VNRIILFAKYCSRFVDNGDFFRARGNKLFLSAAGINNPPPESHLLRLTETGVFDWDAVRPQFADR
jgi:hypothetical protein